jgi:hypothetical protein
MMVVDGSGTRLSLLLLSSMEGGGTTGSSIELNIWSEFDRAAGGGGGVVVSIPSPPFLPS